jgi:hypothetical protein
MSDNPTVYDITTMPPGTQQLMLATETQPYGIAVTVIEDSDPFRVKGPCREEPDFNVLVADLVLKHPDQFTGFSEAYPLTEADEIFYTGVATMRQAELDKAPAKGGIMAVLTRDSA